MPRIILKTKIKAPVERVFDLARSIDLHLISFKNTREKVVSGRKHGLINQNEYVTWKGKHLGVYQRLTSSITYMQRPMVFEDEMIKGPFHGLHHTHYFEKDEKNGNTIMTDVFDYKMPLCFVGCLIDQVYVKKYLKKLLTRRNTYIKDYAENDEKWIQVLNIY